MQWGANLDRFSEDCLYLNVFTTARLGDDVPVLVWIHGGGYVRGGSDAAIFDGSYLARRGIVVVTIKYRLNVFGFLAHPELSAESPHGASGNYGFLDQIAALKWVQHNIKQLGGDPARVTIAGKSAGAGSVSYLMATPLAKGLFHGAMMQSGTTVVFPMSDLKQAGVYPSAETMGKEWADSFGAKDLKSLRALSSRQALAEYLLNPPHKRMLRGVVDGWVFPRQAREIFETDAQADVPATIGSNQDEENRGSNAPFPRTIKEFVAPVEESVPGSRDEFLKAYGPDSNSAGDQIEDAHLSFLRDAGFGLITRRMVELRDEVKLKSPT